MAGVTRYGRRSAVNFSAGVILLLSPAAAAAGLIDDFSVPDPRLNTTASGTYTHLDSRIVGGRRTIVFDNGATTNSVGQLIVGSNNSGSVFAIFNGTDSAGSATLTWNGGDATNGFSDVDLRADGSYAFRLAGFVLDANGNQATLAFTVKDGANESTFTRTLDANPGEFLAVFDEFSDPSVFGSVNSIELQITGSAAYDLNFSTLGTTAVPEPSSLVLLGITCAGLGLYCWRRRCRESTA